MKKAHPLTTALPSKDRRQIEETLALIEEMERLGVSAHRYNLAHRDDPLPLRDTLPKTGLFGIMTHDS